MAAVTICNDFALISHVSEVMLKILQARLQQYVNCEPPDIQAGFRKGTGTRDQIANICWIIGYFFNVLRKKVTPILYNTIVTLLL